MNRTLLLGFASLFLLVSLSGVCVAGTTSSLTAYVQGGESSITDGTNGGYMITVKDVTPYFYITNGEKNSLIPVNSLRYLTYPMSAALVLSGADNETKTLVQVANISLSEGNKILTLQVNPLEFYEGEVLKSFVSEKNELDAIEVDTFANTGIYLEIIGPAPENNNCLAREIFCLKAEDLKSCLGDCYYQGMR